jgi:hypothetical protein
MVLIIECNKPQLAGYVRKIETRHDQITRLFLWMVELRLQLHQKCRNSNYLSPMDKYQIKRIFLCAKKSKISGKNGHGADKFKIISDPGAVKMYTSKIYVWRGQVHSSEPLRVCAHHQIFDLIFLLQSIQKSRDKSRQNRGQNLLTYLFKHQDVVLVFSSRIISAHQSSIKVQSYNSSQDQVFLRSVWKFMLLPQSLISTVQKSQFNFLMN